VHRSLAKRWERDPVGLVLGRVASGADAEVEAAAREDVEHGRLLRDLDRMVELGDADDDAVTDPDSFRHHGARGEEQLGRRTVRVLLEEVVLDRPHLIEAELVGQTHLLERVVVDGALRLPRPGTRNRQLVEQAELHDFAS
jgi:hypothetical protein